MNGERIFNIVVMELSSEVLKLEEELEKAINADLEINLKTQKIKNLLSQIVNTEASLEKFTGMVSVNNNNNNNETKKEEK